MLPQSYQYRNLSEGAERVAGQLHGDKEGPYSGVTKSGRVWKKVPESDARSVGLEVCQTPTALVYDILPSRWRKVPESGARSVVLVFMLSFHVECKGRWRGRGIWRWGEREGRDL